MQSMINHGLAIVIVSVLIALLASALIVLRPWKRRQRHRKRHTHRPKIDLFRNDGSDPAAKSDA